MDVLGSCLTNKYSEGQPGARYYGGQKYIDQIENLCKERALQAFSLDDKEWGVNVQPYSGSPANFAVLTALLNPHDRIMGLGLPSGGHLTHGYYTSMKDGSVRAISATSTYFESLPYEVHPDTGIIDYDEIARMATIFKPKMLICGGSAYPRDYEYHLMRQIADDNNALLFSDMAHSAGLIAGGQLKSPFEYADVVTTTTHKTIRGPRSGMIFGKKELMADLDFGVFPSLQGGPHNHQIAGVATQLKEVCSPEWPAYCKQVMANANALAETLVSRGHNLATGGTDNHTILWDLRPHGISGSKYQMMGDALSITLNKNTIHGDANALNPGAVRIGTSALTTRGFKEDDFVKVADFLEEGLALSQSIQAKVGKKLVNFRPALDDNAEVEELQARVQAFAGSFPMPGREDYD
jgi:glycine hydroxymethyltransferase